MDGEDDPPLAPARALRPRVVRRASGPGMDPDADGAEKEPARTPFVSALDVMNEPPVPCVIEAIGPAGGILLIAGESGVGKSFFTDGLAACIADGRTWWNGLRTQRGSVAKLAFESDAAAARFRALHEHGYTLEDLYVLRAVDPISPRLGRDGAEAVSIGEARVTEALAGLSEDLRRRGRPPIVAILIDTVRASMTGSEDDSGPVTAYLRAVRRILAMTPGAVAILVHHSGWQDGETKKKRERGSSAFRANVDATLFIEPGDDGRPGLVPMIVRCLKARDAEKPPPMRLLRERVTVQQLDSDGEPLTSCVVIADTSTRADREAAAQASEEQAIKDLDVRVLVGIRKCGTKATSLDRIRPFVNVHKGALSAAIARLLVAGLLEQPAKKGQPYTLTPDGEKAAGAEVNP